MRLLVGLLSVALIGCASDPPLEPTAASYADQFRPKFVSPQPEQITTRGLNLPLYPGDKLLADCVEFFADELPEMTALDRMDFEKSVSCVYLPAGELGASGSHYYRTLVERGFQDESGTYVQSGIRILCNRTHTVSIALKSKFTPPFVVDPRTGETIEIEGGGEGAHETLMFFVGEEPCQRYKMSAGFSESPAPERYASFSQPAFVEPTPSSIKVGSLEIALRSVDRLVAHCAQYYREEIGSDLPPDATPSEFAQRNHFFQCIYPPQADVVAASAFYAEQFANAGLTKTSSLYAPKPEADDRFPSIRAGWQEWYGRYSYCDSDQTALMGGMARFGGMILLDPRTGQFWSKVNSTGGRKSRIEGVDYAHKILVLSATSHGC